MGKMRVHRSSWRRPPPPQRGPRLHRAAQRNTSRIRRTDETTIGSFFLNVSTKVLLVLPMYYLRTYLLHACMYLYLYLYSVCMVPIHHHQLTPIASNDNNIKIVPGTQCPDHVSVYPP